MLSIAEGARERTDVYHGLPIAFICTTHIILPMVLFRSAPFSTEPPGSWAGAVLFVSELFGLALTSMIVARRATVAGEAGKVSIAVTVFFCLPTTIVTYLGFFNGLSILPSLIAAGTIEIILLTFTPALKSSGSGRSQGCSLKFGFWARFLVALSCFAFAVMAVNALRYTPCDSDTMWYHLPMVAEWIKTKSIAPIESVSLMARGYPGAREALLTWLSLPMSSENLAFLILIELPASFFALYAICREFDIPADLSLVMASLFLSTPEIALWASSQKNDLFLSVAFLLTFFFLMRWLKTSFPRYALLAGLSGGLLCASKMSGPAYAAALTAVLGGSLALRRKIEKRTGIIQAFGLVSAAAAAVAAPWYVRNIIYFRNPVFPKQVSAFGRTVFAGPLNASFFSPVTLGFDFSHLFADWRQFIDGLGTALPALLATPVLLLVLFFWRKRFQIKIESLLWVVALPALLLVVYMIQPFSLLPIGVNSWEVQPRFLIPFVACLHISTGFILSKLRNGARLGLPVIALAEVRNIAYWTHYWWLLGTLALLAALSIPMLTRLTQGTSVRPTADRFKPFVFALLFAAAVVGSHRMDAFRELQKDSTDFGYIGGISPGWGAVSLYVRHNLSRKRILCLGRPEDFPLYGRGYTNDLYTTDASYALNLIEQDHIDYVVGFRPFVRNGTEGENWDYLSADTKELRRRYPQKFQLVYTADGAEVLKVLE